MLEKSVLPVFHAREVIVHKMIVHMIQRQVIIIEYFDHLPSPLNYAESYSVSSLENSKTLLSLAWLKMTDWEEVIAHCHNPGLVWLWNRGTKFDV